ncbi:MAG TPA: peptide chain release factor N(5)-glutamine methyltransferase [Xanthobacteraceae bacterium]
MNLPLEAAKEMRAESETSIGALRLSAAVQLRKGGIESAELDARILLAHALGMEDAAVLAQSKAKMPEDARRRLEGFLERRLAGEPIARIVGRKEFWSRSFRLGPDTLVPRPETETVVEAALAAFPDRNAELRVLDLGTGSGALLAATLTERLRSFGIGTDRSEGALTVARANLVALGLGSRVAFACGDWGTALNAKFDLIVCNPPYIAAHEFKQLSLEVRDHDPHFALDGGVDGLDAYRAVVSDLARLLPAHGVAVLELGRGQESAVANLTRGAGLFVTGPARLDLAGIPRALTLRLRP